MPPEYLKALERHRYEEEYTAIDLYHQVAHIELVDYRNLDFLGEAGLWQQRPGVALPFWAADWFYRKHTHPLWIHDQDCLRKTNTKLYRAGSDAVGSARISENSRILIVKGKLLGDIVGLADPIILSTNRDPAESPKDL